MSTYNNEDPLKLAAAAERDLNSYEAKQGLNSASDSGIVPLLNPPFLSSPFPFGTFNARTKVRLLTSLANESGVNQSVEAKFPGATVKYGSEASGAGDNRTIPEDEGGDILPSGRPTKARDFEGVGGPEDKAALDRRDRGGDDDVRGTNDA